MERMTITERERAQKGIAKAIANAKKEKERSKEKVLALILLLMAVLHNIACLVEGTTVATVCSIAMYLIISAFIWYLDIL